MGEGGRDMLLAVRVGIYRVVAMAAHVYPRTGEGKEGWAAAGRNVR